MDLVSAALGVVFATRGIAVAITLAPPRWASASEVALGHRDYAAYRSAQLRFVLYGVGNNKADLSFTSRERCTHAGSIGLDVATRLFARTMDRMYVTSVALIGQIGDVIYILHQNDRAGRERMARHTAARTFARVRRLQLRRRQARRARLVTAVNEELSLLPPLAIGRFPGGRAYHAARARFNANK